MASESKFKAGMYLLETLTSGMYNDPFAIYREYVQNAVDSIDIKTDGKKVRNCRINIDLDPLSKTIKIYDNGFGIPGISAQKVLSSIGASEKSKAGLRGFRGIGRLGGLAFCNKATFKTSAKGDVEESVQEWDCSLLKQLLVSPNERQHLTLRQLFEKSTHFYQQNGVNKNDSYFEVTLEGVNSFRNYIFDIKKVSQYLCQVAPVPFSPESFTFADRIRKYLSDSNYNYGEYSLSINGENIFKPYQDKVSLTNKKFDLINDVKFVNLSSDNDLLAVGWYGMRGNFIGAIKKGCNDAGLRVRVGNVMIGDAHLLDGCFKEERFNGYLIGELYVTSKDLIPNSRRDDFVDTGAKAIFYNEVEKEIGVPLSKMIRLKSRAAKLTLKGKSKSHINTENKKTIISTAEPCQDKDLSDAIICHPHSKNIIKDILSLCNKNDLKNIIKNYTINNQLLS